MLMAALLTVSIGASARDYQLPSIGQPADNYMSPAEEEKIGRQVVAQLLDRHLILEDVQLREYLTRVGTRLAAHTDTDASAFRFYPIDSSQINAFALPGGYIGINAGLLTETDNESELAGVMGHEMAHVTQRHIARQIEATSGMGWATAAAILVAAIAGGGDPDALTAAVTAGVSNLSQQQTNFTRAHEFEADRIGIRTMAEADYNPDSMASFFEKLQRRSRLYGNQLPEILLSHPVSNTRMAEAETRARDYADTRVEESDAYPLMKERARVLMSKQYGDLLRYYEQRRKDEGERPALDYGYALTLLQLGRTSDAIGLLEPLLEKAPQTQAYVLAMANARAQAGQSEQARALLERARTAFPNSVAVKLDYAQLLVDGNQPEATRAFLMQDRDLLAQSSQAQQMLARVAGDQGNLGEAYYRQAKYYELRGNYGPAINQLRTALQTADLNAFDKARLRALLDQMVKACHTAWSERECREQVTADARY
ncbi:putative peptidase protein [Salinisphaera shabanensis E1L3A]|uniref:Peptidase protein n=2 Tax=Salinisphaera shabanensis TaxID=180542 RepID=U2EKB8_9GAMM|nr:putative peptidase protein [Salinisphaera shabanensis E1L3A]